MLIPRVCVADPERTQFVLSSARPTGESQIPPQPCSLQQLYPASPYPRILDLWVLLILADRMDSRVLGEHLMNQPARETRQSLTNVSPDKQRHRLEAWRRMAIEHSDRGAAGRGRGGT